MKRGWQTKKLQQVCKLLNGRAYNKSELLDDGIYPVLRVGNFFTNNHWYYSDLELEESKYCNTGDLLYAWSASFGPRIWTGGKAIFHYHIWKVVHDHAQVDKKYLFYFFQWDTEQAKAEQGAGTTMLHVSMGSMNERDIQIPPLPEQQRIVALLDEAFAGLATAKASAERNLENARAVFEGHLESVFSQRREGWDEMALSELCEIKHGYAFDGQFFRAEGDYVLLTPGNFHETGGYRDRGEKQKFFTGEIPRDYVLQEGDLLVAMTEQAEGLLGSSLLAPESNKFLHNQRLGLVKAKPGVPWSNKFFFHVFNTQRVRREIHASASGVKVRHTSPSKIGEVVVSYPLSLQEQQKLVEELASISAETQRLTQIYERKLAALEELKQSLLQQAFNGEL